MTTFGLYLAKIYFFSMVNLGNYTYQIKNTLKNEGFQDKIFGKKEGQ
jgi:hypothetical protein